MPQPRTSQLLFPAVRFACVDRPYSIRHKFPLPDPVSDMKEAVFRHKERNTVPSPAELSLWLRRYRVLIRKGRADNPPSAAVPGHKKHGRKKQTKPQNLIDRLEKFGPWVLAFLHDFRIPFTNNLAEQDIRMIKVKQKISGSFRTMKGAESFFNIRSYISTTRKNGLQIFPEIVSALNGNPFIPL